VCEIGHPYQSKLFLWFETDSAQRPHLQKTGFSRFPATLPNGSSVRPTDRGAWRLPRASLLFSTMCQSFERKHMSTSPWRSMWIVSLAESLRRDLRSLSIQKGPIASTAGDEHVESFEAPTVSCERWSRSILQSGQSASQEQRTGTSTAIVSHDYFDGSLHAAKPERVV
jgi:hypothetical protein